METLQDPDTPVLDSDPPSDQAQDEAQDIAQDVAQDVAQDLGQDLALELRVLTGLQAGAALPFDQALLVGHADDCDLLLLDDLAPPHLLEITPNPADGFTLTPLHEGLILADGTALADPVSLRPGDIFGIDGLWLEVQASEAPWSSVSDTAGHAFTQQHEPDAEAWAADEGAAPTPAWHDEDSSGELGGAGHGEARDATNSRPGVGAMSSADANHASMDLGWMKDAEGEDSPWRMDPSERVVPKPATARAGSVAKPRWQTLGVIGVGALLTLSGLTAMAVQWGIGTERPEPSLQATSARDGTEAAARPEVGSTADAMSATPSTTPSSMVSDRRADASVAVFPEADRVPSATTATPTTTVTSATIAMTAATATRPDTPNVPPERPGRVRVTGGVTIVRADTDIVLPFEVREVVLGARSRVVLSNGQTLLPGDAVGRWRLMDIKPGTLVFEGPQRVLLPW